MQRSPSDGHRPAVTASFSGHHYQQGARCQISLPWKAHLSHLNDFLPCCEATSPFSVRFAPSEIMASVMFSSGLWRYAWREGIPEAAEDLPQLQLVAFGSQLASEGERCRVCAHCPHSQVSAPLANSRDLDQERTSCLIWG